MQLRSALFSTVSSLSNSNKALVHIFGWAGLPQRALRSLRAFGLQGTQTLWRTDTEGLYSQHCVFVHVHVLFSSVLFSFDSTWAVPDRGHWLGVLCVTILLYNGCVLCPVTKLFNYSELTSSFFLSASPFCCVGLSLLLCLPLSTSSCQPVYINLTVVLIAARLESRCQVVLRPRKNFLWRFSLQPCCACFVPWTIICFAFVW